MSRVEKQALGTEVVLAAGGPVIRKEEVKKHVAAIHTSGELSLLERKLVNVLLLNAYDQLGKERTHSIPTKLLMAMLGWTESEDTVTLKKALSKLVSTPIEFNLMEDGDPEKSKRWTTTALIAQGEILDGRCEYEYSTRLESELSNPDVYAVINVGIQRQFRSGYALTLYENCLRYRKVGSTGTIPLEKFRKLLGATSPTYADFRRLSELVLNKAVAEVNKVSDITVTPEYERKGRKVVGVRFVVEEKRQQTIFAETDLQAEQARKTETFARLVKHGVGEKLAIAWIIQDEARARQAIDLAEQKARQNLITRSTGGYVRTLMEDTTIELGPSAYVRELTESKEREKQQEQAAAEASAAEEQRKNERAERLKGLVRALSEEQLTACAKEYVESANAADVLSFNPETGKFANVTEKLAFMTWLRSQLAAKHNL